LAVKGDLWNGGKNFKERLTVVLACGANGTNSHHLLRGSVKSLVA